MVNDPIADALSRIRNAHERGYKSVRVLNTKIVKEIVGILNSEKYIESFEVDTEDKQYLNITLKYENKKPAIKDLKRISKPGLRKYIGYTEIPKVLNGMGISILSTPKGIITGKEAKAQKLGGEFLCTIY
jgi:small subunit ribosomal protein S8